MNCREAKLLMTGSTRVAQELKNDSEFQDHVSACAACAREMEAFKMLRKVIEVSSEDDLVAMKSIEESRKLVEARRGGSRGKRSISWSHLPKLRLAGGLAVVAVLIMAIVPFSYSQVVGYEVALDGVDRSLVEGDDVMCELLDQIGLVEAAVDLMGCEQTCSMLVFDLKTKQEAEIVVAAITDISDELLSADVIPIRTSVSRTLFDRANESLGL